MVYDNNIRFDGRFMKLSSGKITTTDSGSFTLAFTIPDNANLGSAQVRFKKAQDSDFFYHNFTIQEVCYLGYSLSFIKFRTPEFKISSSVESTGPFIYDELPPINKEEVTTETKEATPQNTIQTFEYDPNRKYPSAIVSATASYYAGGKLLLS
jgi:hypothetical protein